MLSNFKKVLTSNNRYVMTSVTKKKKTIIKNKEILNKATTPEKSHQEFLVDYYQNILPVTTRYLNAIEDFKKKY